MYRASSGIRTFDGPFGQLLKQAIYEVGRRLCGDLVDAEDDEQFGVRYYDRMSHGQKLWLLVNVGEALLYEHVPPPEFTADVESTVGMLFEVIASEVQVEMEMDDPPQFVFRTFRRLVGEASAQEKVSGEEKPIPPPDSTDKKEFALLIQCLREQILWDDDWEMDPTFSDMEPDFAAALKDSMDVPEDYFTHITRDPECRA